MMKNLLFSTFLASGVAGSAVAGNVNTSPAMDQEPVVAAAATEWSGLYIGAVASTEAGAYDYHTNGTPDNNPFAMTGSMAGGFVGYNFQRDKLVFGAEVNYSAGTIGFERFPTYEYSSLIDVNARVGYSLGRALVYATAGGSFGAWTNDAAGTFSASGFNYGIGVDFMVSNRIFIGAEYLNREMDGDFGSVIPNRSFENDNQSLRVRAGLQF